MFYFSVYDENQNNLYQFAVIKWSDKVLMEKGWNQVIKAITYLIISYQFSPWFSILDKWTPHFHKTLDMIGSNFFYKLNLTTENLMTIPTPPPSLVSELYVILS